MPTYADNSSTAVAARANCLLFIPGGDTFGADASTAGRNFASSSPVPGSLTGYSSFNRTVNNYFTLADEGTGSTLHPKNGVYFISADVNLSVGQFTDPADAGAILTKWNDGNGNQEFVLQFTGEDVVDTAQLVFAVSSNGTNVPGAVVKTGNALGTALHVEAYINPAATGAEMGLTVNRSSPTTAAFSGTVFTGVAAMRIGNTENNLSKMWGLMRNIAIYSVMPSTAVRDYLATGANPFALATGDVAPTVTGASVNTAGATIALVPSETVVLNGATAADFTLTGCVGDEVLSGLALSGGNIVLTVSPALAGGMLPKIAYTGTLITDTTGNALAAFTARSVTNNSTALITSPSTGTRLQKAQRNKLATYAVNRRTIPGGSVVYTAANGYPISLLDMYLAWRTDPTFMTDSQWSAYLGYLLTNKDGSNNVPIFQFDDVTPGVYDQLIYTDGYNQSLGHVPPSYKVVGDGTWCIPILLKYLYDRTGSLTLWNTHKAGILSLLAGRAVDPGSSGLIWGDSDAIPDYGFHDGLHLQGKKLDGSVMAYRANGDAAALCTASGDSSGATACTTRRNLIATNIGQLRDSTTGLYFACSTSANLDIYFSALAVEFGLVTGSNAVGVANGLNTALASIIDPATGFIYQTIGNWVSGTMRSDNPYGGQGYYDGAGWLYEAKPVLSLLGTVNLSGAYATVDQILAGSNPTREWVRKSALSTGVAGGKEGNLANMAQIWGAIQALDSISSGGTVATPTFSPPAGAVASGTVVTISTATGGATIHRTLDDTEADGDSPTGTTVTIMGPTTIHAIGVKAGVPDSDEATASYTVIPGGGGGFTDAQATMLEDLWALQLGPSRRTPSGDIYKGMDGSDRIKIAFPSPTTRTLERLDE